MALKMCFVEDGNLSYVDKMVEYMYYSGFASSQKKKNIESIHRSLQKIYPDKKILEVSSKSENPFGVACSAFHLKLDGYPLESVFQSAKVFNGNISFPEVLSMEPAKAKKYIKQKVEEGNLQVTGFCYKGVKYPNNPKSLFYDYMYLHALMESDLNLDEVMKYEVFTDVEFNYKKQYNCQARSLLIYKYLRKQKKIDWALSSWHHFNFLIYNNAYRIQR